MSDLISRFWEKVNKTGECWIWTASKRGPGYGQCSLGGRRQGYAHRFSYEIHFGSIPAGMVIDHICHNKLCVKPDHLQAVTPKQNQENLLGARVTSSSGVRGVSWNAEKKRWQVFVRSNRKSTFGGYFANIHEAEQAATTLRNQLFTNNLVDRKVA